ncbi:MAG: NAD(P)/FAD-dependent oxidoreductase [Alphaproteobacteria bacterium]|nr:NAD(P)/FAD-dependent oxidoreductase [Alphaproteobacteria bacterium]
MSSESIECAVIGAGVVGLAVARALALAGREVVVLEAADAIGTGISSRNSEVIHAGIYYPAGGLKARLCVAGRRALVPYCREHGVPHRMLGKLIVATSAAETELLPALMAKAAANGVDDLRLLSAAEARALEPDLACTAAVLSPSTGIVDSHALMLSYLGEAESRGASLALRAPVIGGRVADDGIHLDVGGADPMELVCRAVVDSAGLGAWAVARSIKGVPPASIPPGHLCKGNYFALTGKRPFAHLVYPVPEAAGLGTHFTLDMGGQGRFGPDVEWVADEDYTVDARRADAFYGAIRRYWPGLPDDALVPAYAGIRPKLQAPGEPARDFLIEGPSQHGVPGWVALYGIESPGLTASPAIADMVAEMLA